MVRRVGLGQHLKTTDGGANWRPIFDSQPVQAVGALAVAPSDKNTVWAGSGEAWAIRESDVMGDGVYKSTDAGATWQHMGLRDRAHRPASSCTPATPTWSTSVR